MEAYLTKWVPPRGHSLPTSTEREGSLMKQHGAWQAGLLRQGFILTHGPVLARRGNCRVAIWQVEDDADIAALTAQDPIVRAGIGHYEHFPMLQAKACS